MQNRVAASWRCRAIALDLAEVTGDNESIFMARLQMFRRMAEAGDVEAAEDLWRLLMAETQRPTRSQYRPGDAELFHAQFYLDRGILTEEQLVRAESLARSGNNRQAIRGLHAIRGEWLYQKGDLVGAVESHGEAVRMARETGVVASSSETRLALARLRLGQLPSPIEEARRLANLHNPSHLTLAELWREIGQHGRAIEHASVAYRHAWADGEPHVRRYQLSRAADIVLALGASIPDLKSSDELTASRFAWEDQLVGRVK